MAYSETISIDQLEIDPYPVYARLRREQPVAFIPAANVWFATRWSDVETVTKSPELFSAEAPTSPVEISFGKPTILTTDGPVHDELRGGIEPHYKPRKVKDYIEALVRPIAEACLATVMKSGHVDLIADYFEPVSALSLARSFGLNNVDAPTLRNWFHGLSQGAINYERDPSRQKISDAMCAEIDAAILPLLHQLATQPDGSPLSHMLHHGMPEGQTRDPSRILPSIKVTLLGGMQEPGHGAASVLIGLFENPAQLAAVRADMANVLPRAVDEGLRWVAPIGTQMRVAISDVELGGAIIPAGAPVAAILSSANRDETKFADPDQFNIFRAKSSHAAFGFGAHFCAGKWFAKSQIEIALDVLLTALPDIRLDPERLPQFRGWEFRAPTSLHVFFSGSNT
jgi:cytochrome P450